MGGTTNLFPSMTLGSGSVGKGMTSDNVSPMNLVYIRKVGFEVRNKEELLKSIGVNENIILDLEDTKKEESLDNVKLLKNILKEILKEKNKYEKE